jgi:hypothetical protein
MGKESLQGRPITFTTNFIASTHQDITSSGLASDQLAGKAQGCM